MSADDAGRWKEKYLKSIEQQEKLEDRWKARLDLLRRGLVRSTLAAEGTDRSVDQCMKEMREVVRSDEMDAALAALLPRLEKAVLDSEQRRETRTEQISTAMNTLVTQLQALPLPREVSKPLKVFARQLESRVNHAREMPLLLDELSHLQGQALAPQLGEVRPGLLQRLFGADKAAAEPAAPEPDVLLPGRRTEAQALDVRPDVLPASEVKPQASSAPPSEVAAVQPPLGPVEASPPVPDEPVLDASSSGALESVVAQVEAENNLTENRVEPATPDAELRPVLAQSAAASLAAAEPEQACGERDAVFVLPESPEPSYSSVAAHIESTLLGLLSDLSLPEHHQPQAEAVRSRLEKGLNWYELLPILDDLAVLMLAVTDSGQHEFEAYLKQLNERLEAFQGHLQVASEDHADSSLAARELDTQIREQVDGLQSSVQEAADLGSLKQVLESHLEGLLGTMNEHQQQRDQREQEVAARLKGLAERVANMEQEAQGYREHLEVQRQKALLDPLTGLPNRAAWSERLDHEVNAWHQHGNSLALAMLDLDHFKRINDGYGHLAGDKVLKIIANVLSKRLRPTDFIARFGGEEFVLLMPDSTLADALAVGEVLRGAIEACPFHFKGEPVTITVSMGVAQFQPGERSDLALKRADEALYRAKAAGRNQVQAA